MTDWLLQFLVLDKYIWAKSCVLNQGSMGSSPTFCRRPPSTLRGNSPAIRFPFIEDKKRFLVLPKRNAQKRKII